jgi:SWI/SNF-related matrix-associated actin-dependent regulator 1 of chromatin subfamily A
MILLPHQIEDAAFLASRAFAGCFSGMGSGKTRTALEAARLVGSRAIVIIAPPIALRMWEREAKDHLGLSVQIIKTGAAKIDPLANVLIMSYEIATKRAAELKTLAQGETRPVLICDESHALKSTTAKRTKAILGSGGIVGAFAHSWLLTGTPSTRWNDDLIPFLFRAAPDVMKAKLGGLSIERFQIRYTVRQQKQFPGARFPVTMTVGSRNTEELREILYTGANRVAVRRELADVWAAMPPITHNRYSISLSSSPELTAALADLRSMSRAQVEEKLAAKDPALSTMRRMIGLGKVAAAAEVIAERAGDTAGAVLVGAWHTEVIDGLCAAVRAKGLRCEILDGRTSMSRKSELEAMFNAGGLDVLVGQIGAMGVSLNLQRGGNCIIVVEEDWSPAIMDQFYARLYRMGQERHVHIDTLETETKIDEAIHKISAEKARHHAKLNAGEEA